MKKIIIATVLAVLLLLVVPAEVSAAGVTVVDRTGDGKWTNNAWQVEIYPGETKATTIKLYNSSSSSLSVTVNVSPDSLDGGNLIFELDKATLTMPGKSYADTTISVKASGSTTPGTYIAELEIKYEVPPTPSSPIPSEPTVVEPVKEEPVEPPVVEPDEPIEPEEHLVEEPEVVEPVEEPEEEEPEVVEPEDEKPEVKEPKVEEPEVEKPEDKEPIVEPEPRFPWGWIIGAIAGLGLVIWGIIYWREKRKDKE